MTEFEQLERIFEVDDIYELPKKIRGVSSRKAHRAKKRSKNKSKSMALPYVKEKEVENETERNI